MYEKPSEDKLKQVEQIRNDWTSGNYTMRQLHKKYGIRCDSICYGRSYNKDGAYKPRPKGSTRPRG